jgi:hypothetical protein
MPLLPLWGYSVSGMSVPLAPINKFCNKEISFELSRVLIFEFYIYTHKVGMLILCLYLTELNRIKIVCLITHITRLKFILIRIGRPVDNLAGSRRRWRCGFPLVVLGVRGRLLLVLLEALLWPVRPVSGRQRWWH